MNWSYGAALDWFPRLADRWDELNGRLHQSHPLLDSRFVGACVAHFANGGDVLLAIHGRGSADDGMLLLTRPRWGVWRTFLPSQAPIAPVLLGRNADVQSLLRRLPGPNLWIDMLCQDASFSTLAVAGPLIEQMAHALTIRVDLAGSFDHYWAARPGKLRQNLRRAFRLLECEGTALALRVISDASGIDEALVRYGNLESRGWKARAGTALHAANGQGCFYREVLRAFAARGEATIYELDLNGRLAASLITVGNGSMLVMLKNTYDESLARYSPGRVLYFKFFEHEFARKRYESVEFYTNARPELTSWGTASRWINHVTIYGGPWRSRAASLARGLRARVHRGTTPGGVAQPVALPRERVSRP